MLDELRLLSNNLFELLFVPLTKHRLLLLLIDPQNLTIALLPAIPGTVHKDIWTENKTSSKAVSIGPQKHGYQSGALSST